ncbi:unnamed protein product [Psylliodes chrysocephalus]|uniref:Uncharacterized protein n=1 Tax=Psylliodes chrysocephalus TaxID=3402493 RepID=A0A9P0G751_9CUCU|nr:unnamed protein product [Psylliodes chrysocephala]
MLNDVVVYLPNTSVQNSQNIQCKGNESNGNVFILDDLESVEIAGFITNIAESSVKNVNSKENKNQYLLMDTVLADLPSENGQKPYKDVEESYETTDNKEQNPDFNIMQELQEVAEENNGNDNLSDLSETEIPGNNNGKKNKTRLTDVRRKRAVEKKKAFRRRRRPLSCHHGHIAEDEYQGHLKQKSEAMDQKKKDKITAIENPDTVLVITVDMEAVKLAPV